MAELIIAYSFHMVFFQIFPQVHFLCQFCTPPWKVPSCHPNRKQLIIYILDMRTCQHEMHNNVQLFHYESSAWSLKLTIIPGIA